MYYLYDKKSKNTGIVHLDYTFNNFDQFYAVASMLTNTLRGTYKIKITCDKPEPIIQFVENSDNYKHLIIYIETEESSMQRVKMNLSGVSLLKDRDSKEIWYDLIGRYQVLLKPKCAEQIFWGISKDEATMSTVLLDLKEAYGLQSITFEMAQKVVSINEVVYPKSVMMAYLRMDRFRESKLKKSIETIGPDILFYSIRKNIEEIYRQKCNYYVTGKGSDAVKNLPFNNIIKMYYAFRTLPIGFKDITIILKLYEKGAYINDYL